ncbi:MAG: periplasmic/7TM domain sensor diguanylate cyclase [Massilibacillus sp.]|jgi:diguanylate cyclase (GGDEF)-like protein|nr:periplasmic/7TM domain sensor diguanylate cyclase [Massilibacillus sp.]
MKIYFRKLITIFLLLFVFSLHTVFAGEKQGTEGHYSITNFETFEDVNGVYDFATISSPAFSEQFQLYKQDAISLGISKSVYWIRFVLPTNDNSQIDAKQLLELSNPSISKIDLYLPVVNSSDMDNLQYLEKHVGAERPSTNRDIWDTSWVFDIPQQYAQGQYIYLKLESISTLRLPILVWQENSFFKKIFIENIGYGIFYGVLIAVFLYNLFIVFVLRDKTYLFYVLYIFFMFIYQFNAHGHLKLWLNIEYSLYNALFWICLSAGFIFSILFTASFLQVHDDEAVWSKIIKMLLVTAIIQGILGAFGYSILANKIANCLGIIEPSLFMALAIFRICQGFHPAIFYLLAWGILSLGILVWILSSYRIMAENVLMFTTASEAILLSLALSDRFKTLRLKELVLTRNIHYYRDLSLTDELTGLYNRRYLKKKMQQEISRAVQEEKSMALIVIDIDLFKKYNDTYGHWQGDQVLIRFSEVLLNILDGTQTAFRFGGEEFVVLLPNAFYDDATVIAERIRSHFAAEEFVPVEDSSVHVTISAGFSILKLSDTEEILFERADKALYQAKKSGRNKVVFL